MQVEAWTGCDQNRLLSLPELLLLGVLCKHLKHRDVWINGHYVPLLTNTQDAHSQLQTHKLTHLRSVMLPEDGLGAGGTEGAGFTGGTKAKVGKVAIVSGETPLYV